MKKVEIESKQRVFDDFFKVDETYFRHERFDGQMSKSLRQLVFERGDSVAAVVVNKDTGRVILVNQFRFPTYAKGPGWILEIIAGTLEENETPEEAIRREVLEETGYNSDRLTHISTFYVSPGGTSERIILYHVEVDNAGRVTGSRGLGTEQEDIQIVEFSLPELWRALKSGQIVDAKTIIGLMWLQNKVAP